MKTSLDEATELFRENAVKAGDDREKADLYDGLGLLTEGLRRRNSKTYGLKCRLDHSIFISDARCDHFAD